MRWRLNILSLNDETVKSLGIMVVRERRIMLIVVVAATAAMISISGIVNWIGLIVPQLARRLFGADTRYSLPGAILIGAIFTVLCDDIARAAMPGEIPLGIITSLLGTLLFISLLVARQRHKT
jgi:iron complex transport system permease protein